MPRRWRRFAAYGPTSMAARIVLAILTIVALVQFVSWIFSDGREFDKPEIVAAHQLVAATELLDRSDPGARDALSAALSGVALKVSLEPDPPDNLHRIRFDDGIDNEALETFITGIGNRPYLIGASEYGWWDGDLVIAVQLGDGTWARYALPFRVFTLDNEGGSGFWGTVGWIVLIGFVIWMANRLTRPIRAFADAAERLGRDVNAPPLAERGTRELRRATRAFNLMQDRVRRMINDRTLMLAAISHDLKTVLTRLRLRAEFIEDADQQAKAAADIEEMQAMLEASLAFAKGETQTEKRQTIDLAALVRTAAAELDETGRPVHFSGPEHLFYECGPIELKRVVVNLVRNALAYGHEAWVRLHADPGQIVLTVEDRGPGIAAPYREQVFQPFFRVESSRNRETGGQGLGLAIARTIIRRHGGDITLGDSSHGGLLVRVVLPPRRAPAS